MSSRSTCLSCLLNPFLFPLEKVRRLLCSPTLGTANSRLTPFCFSVFFGLHRCSATLLGIHSRPEKTCVSPSTYRQLLRVPCVLIKCSNLSFLFPSDTRMSRIGLFPRMSCTTRHLSSSGLAGYYVILSSFNPSSFVKKLTGIFFFPFPPAPNNYSYVSRHYYCISCWKSSGRTIEAITA